MIFAKKQEQRPAPSKEAWSAINSMEADVVTARKRAADLIKHSWPDNRQECIDALKAYKELAWARNVAESVLYEDLYP